MISVIIPCNKDRGFLDRAIKSIEMQDCPHEVIVSMSNNLMPYNFNRGLEKAKGEYVKLIHEDDYLLPGGLKKLVDGIKSHPWIFANAFQDDNPEWIYRPGDYTRDYLSLQENLSTNRIHISTTLYRTKVLREVGGMDETLWTAEEYDMHLKLWTRGYIPGYIDKVVAGHMMWSGQKSRQFRRQDKQKRDAFIQYIQNRYK